MGEFDDMNRQVIEEFRANEGVVDTAAGGYLQGQADAAAAHDRGEDGRGAGQPADVPRRGRPPLRLRLEGRRPGQPGLVPQPRANPDVTVEVGHRELPGDAPA